MAFILKEEKKFSEAQTEENMQFDAVTDIFMVKE